MISIFNFRDVTRQIHQAVMLRRNPRLPDQLRAIYDKIGGSRRMLSHNTKVGKHHKDILSSSRKTKKSEKHGWYVSILHLLPATMGKKLAEQDPERWGVTAEDVKKMRTTLCAGASKGCLATCLIHSGQLGMCASTMDIGRGQQAAMRRTLLNQIDAEGFFTYLILSIHKARIRAYKNGFKNFAMRLNGTSDINYLTIPVYIRPWFHEYLRSKNIEIGRPRRILEDGTLEFPNIMAVMPYVLFYDYTKVKSTVLTPRPDNYHLTFSMNENSVNRMFAWELLTKKIMNVTVVCDTPGRYNSKNKELPKSIVMLLDGKGYEFPVLDGDEHDLRFLDRPQAGAIVCLRWKYTSDAELNRQAKENTGVDKFIIPTKGKIRAVVPVTKADVAIVKSLDV